MVQIMVFKIMDLWEMTQIEYCLGDEIADKGMEKCIMIATLGSHNHSSHAHLWHALAGMDRI